MTASEHPGRQLGVDKRPWVEINMKLLSLNKGATHGYVNEDYWVRYAVEQGQVARPEATAEAKRNLGHRIRLQLDHRARELALFNLAIDNKLRGCDLVGLRVHDIVQGRGVAPREIVMQKKTPAPAPV